MCVMVEYVGDSTFGGGSGITYTLLDYDSRIVTHGSKLWAYLLIAIWLTDRDSRIRFGESISQ